MHMIYRTQVLAVKVSSPRRERFTRSFTGAAFCSHVLRSPFFAPLERCRRVYHVLDKLVALLSGLAGIVALVISLQQSDGDGSSSSGSPTPIFIPSPTPGLDTPAPTIYEGPDDDATRAPVAGTTSDPEDASSSFEGDVLLEVAIGLLLVSFVSFFGKSVLRTCLRRDGVAL